MTSPLECTAGTIVTRRPCVSTVPPAFMPITSAASPSCAAEIQAELVDAGHRRVQAAGEGERPGVEVVEVPVRHKEHVAPLLGRLGPRAVRVAEPGIDQQHLPAGGRHLDAGVAQPGERGAASDRHRSLLPRVGARVGRRSGHYRRVRPGTGSRLHSARARRADRHEPRAHQLDAAHRPRRRLVRRRPARPPRPRPPRRATSRSPRPARPRSACSPTCPTPACRPSG